RNAPCKMAALARPSLVQAHRNRRSGAARVFRIPRIDGEKTRSLPRFFEHTRKAKDGRDNSMMDVLVAGAGIAGSALAIHLGGRGYSVVLVERSSFPREKPCGEGLMPAGVAALERLGI